MGSELREEPKQIANANQEHRKVMTDSKSTQQPRPPLSWLCCLVLLEACRAEEERAWIHRLCQSDSCVQSLGLCRTYFYMMLSCAVCAAFTSLSPCICAPRVTVSRRSDLLFLHDCMLSAHLKKRRSMQDRACIHQS